MFKPRQRHKYYLLQFHIQKESTYADYGSIEWYSILTEKRKKKYVQFMPFS